MAILKEDVERSSGSTVVGQSILISGRLTGDEDLTVRGRLEGELNLTQTLVVEATGVVKANVTAKSAIVSGVVVGNITASESVELTREGRMVGDIRAPRIIIAEGASYRGHVDMGEVDLAMAENDERSSRPALRSVSRSERAERSERSESRPARSVQIPVSRPEPRATSERRIELKPSSNGASASRAPAPPPVPPLMAQASKRKVVFKRKR